MEDHQAILQVLSEYFAGLFAELDSQSYRKSLDAYLEGVAQRASPEVRGEPFRMRVLSVDVLHNIAMAKAHVPAPGFSFDNYLSLVRRDGRWIIVNKIFADVPVTT